MAYYYLKLHHEMLHDPKMGMLPDHLYRRVIELFLMASERQERDGYLPTVDVMAWQLHITPGELQNDLVSISETGIIQNINGCWYVTNFVKRQASDDPTAAERVRRYRERNNTVTNTQDVTRNVTRNEDEMLRVELRVKNLDIDKEIDKESDAKLPPVSSALDSFQDHSARDAERLYQSITNQPTIPPNQLSEALPLLIAILDSYNGDKSNALKDGQAFFAKWCNTTGKNGRRYAATNANWLNWWNEARAPRPVSQAKNIPQPTALCGEGERLKRQAENAAPYEHEQAILNYRSHIDTCHICGGREREKSKPIPQDVQDKIRALTGKMEVKK